MTKEQAFDRWRSALPEPVQQNIRDGLKNGRSFTQEAFFAATPSRYCMAIQGFGVVRCGRRKSLHRGIVCV